MVVLSSLEQVLDLSYYSYLVPDLMFTLLGFISIDGDRPWASASPAALH